MQIIDDKTQLDFEAFKCRFPQEAEILKGQQDQPILLKIYDKQISFMLDGFSAIKIDIKNSLQQHRNYFYKNSLYKEPLARAIGLKKGKPKPIVLDATAGMLGDSLLLYSFGVKQLIVCERQPIVCAMIINALAQVQVELDLFIGNAVNYFAGKPLAVDVIYFDPMYKQINTKTAPKKEMATFRSLIGVDEDAEFMAMKLKTFARERLVIKRSRKAQPLIANPSHSIHGKSTSYDVYLTSH